MHLTWLARPVKIGEAAQNAIAHRRRCDDGGNSQHGMLLPMMTRQSLHPAVRESLTRLAHASDRTSPTVFAGREDEIALLDAAVRATQRGEVGHTVIIQGVPGAGKTALLNEYAARLLAAEKTERPIIPVPLNSGHLNAPATVILREMQRKFHEFEASDELQATVTRKDFSEFLASAKAPRSLSVALDDYFAVHFGRCKSTVVMLVDEAQNMSDTIQVREHLESLHSGIMENTQVMLVCFGLENTADRLCELGLSRFSRACRM